MTDQTAEARTPWVAVCVCTFQRPQGIRALLASLDALAFEGPAPRITIVIADNAPDAPAFASSDEAQAASRWSVIYVAEPRRGIATARNAALRAVPSGVTAVAFVDDDETVVPEWLEALLATMIRTGAEVARGPVRPVYAETPPAWVTALNVFGAGPFVEGAPLTTAATNNVLVDHAFIQRHGLAFDPRFDLTGGEDEEFFGRVRLAGGRIVASARAEVFDMIPASRLSFKWAWRRQCRRGDTLTRIARLRRRGLAMRFAKACGALGYGALDALLGVRSETRRVRGLLEIGRALGMFAGFVGVPVEEYGEAAVLQERGARIS
jgi:glycosyltransferase involved in cell wall biosynthesis